MTLTPVRALLTLLLCTAMAACSSLPRGAAIDTELLSQADDADADIAVYPVTRAFLPSLTAWPSVGEPELPWITASRGSFDQVINGGDFLDIRIWDSGQNSLLTAPEQRSVDMARMRVAAGGSIFLPYIGKVHVAGKTTDAARTQIQRALEEVVPSAQVQLSVAPGRKNSIDLVGGVTAPGTYPMPDLNYTVLNLLSAGGGVRPGLPNPQIRLVRHGQIYGTSVEKLFATPQYDSRLIGGDKVIIEQDRRYFLSIGATGREALHPFTKDRITAMDALSIVGGVNDSRGDPQGILILREYPAEAVQPGARGPRMQRVVFTVDLTDTDGLFSARNFDIQSGDLVLATESPVTSVRTVLSLVGSAFGVFNAVTD